MELRGRSLTASPACPGMLLLGGEGWHQWCLLMTHHQLGSTSIFWRKSLGLFAPFPSSALCRWDLDNYLLCVPGFWVAKVDGYDSFFHSWPVLSPPFWGREWDCWMWVWTLKTEISQIPLWWTFCKYSETRWSGDSSYQHYGKKKNLFKMCCSDVLQRVPGWAGV